MSGAYAVNPLYHVLSAKSTIPILSLCRTPQSYTELARRFGTPRNYIAYHLRRLLKAGLLAKDGHAKKYSATPRALYILGMIPSIDLAAALGK